MRLHALPLALFPTLVAAPGAAQQFLLEIDAKASSIAFGADFDAELPSSVIGNYDAKTNPGGTRTLPGLSGGSGNVAIPMQIGLGGSSDFVSMPQGRFELAIDEPGLAFEIHALELDLLGGVPATAESTISALFNTFRTFQPDSIYFGGTPIELPLGEGSLVEARLAQIGTGVGGSLVPGAPGTYSFQAVVPALLTMAVESMGTTVPLGAVPIALPISGHVTLRGGSASAGFAFELFFDQTIPDPLPGFAIEDQPLDLPTILPPGQTAHLLLDATIASISLQVVGGGGIEALEVAPCGLDTYCEAALNSSGAAGSIAVSGSAEVGDADLQFVASGLPAHTTGFLVMANEAAFLPAYRGHAGHLCLSPPQVRFAHAVLDSGDDGSVSYAPDFAHLPNGVSFEPGSIWHFQFWFRDMDPGPTWNSTDAARVRFCAGG